MRVKITKTNVYKFDELSEGAKDRAIEKLYYINVNHDWWDYVYDDAEEIGLKIEGFDLGRANYCKGKFTQSAEDVAKAIIENYGKDCETYKTAMEYLNALEVLRNGIEDEDEDVDTEEIDEEFLKSLCEDYRIMLSREYDYLTSRESIIETIEANEYEFDEDGNLA